MKTHLLRCLAALALLVPAHAADVTVSDTLVALASSVNGTKNYTFTDAGSGQSVTVAVTMSPFSQTAGEVFTLLDNSTHLGIGPGGTGDDNHVDSTEGVNFAASLVSASAGVTASSVRFRVVSIGLRNTSGPTLSWVSSATGSNGFVLNAEALFTLDSTTASLSGASYAGQLRFVTSDDLQLSDAVTGGLGLVLNATFSTDGTTVQPPLISSWFTRDSGRYARIYETLANQSAGTTSLTWSRGAVAQTLPAYAGVQEISSSASYVYVRTTGLGFHNMGPWYLDAGKSQLFPNLPGNTATLWRFPRTPSASASPTLTTLGAIGYFVDGVAMFDGQDGYYWNGTAEAQSGTGGLWNRDAYPEEGVSFDPGNAHQEQTGTYHYHANPLALRFQLGDNVTYNAGTKTWSETAGTPTKHSPILGWVKDGYPIYGPYGYSSPSNSSSGIRRMTTGYLLRNGQNGTVNLATTGRVTLPAWAARGRVRSATLAANEFGPNVTGIYTIGRYHEDYEYLGDVGQTQGVNFDLDEHNGRFCVTPEFPNGTYAYFMTINSSGTPVYPYNIGRVFKGTTSGGPVTSITETVTTNFVGGPNVPVNVARPTVSGGTVTLAWSAAEGGTYTVESRSEVNGSWTPVATGVALTGNAGSRAVTPAGSRAFYRVARTALASYSTTAAGTGGGGGGGGTPLPPTIASVTPNSGTASASATVTITLGGTNLPPADAVPTSVTLGSASGTGISYNGSAVSATFTLPVTTGLQNVVVTFPAPPTGGVALTITGTNVFTVNAAGGGGGGGTPAPPTIASVTPNSGTASASATVTITLGGTNLPPADAVPTSVTLGSASGTGISYNGTAVTATFTLPVTTGLQNVVVTFPAPPTGGVALVITGTNVFTVNAGGGGGGGTSATTAPGGTATRGSTVTVTITLPTDPPQPPLTDMMAQTILPSSVTLAGITGTSISRPAQGTVVATFVIPANAATGAQNVVVTFPPPPGMPMGATYTLTGGVTIQ
ncbi:MAG: Uncharacterized protein FD161_3098 [Limisphaerales bacterium]|nr:MAG: Uncharacterized protein FD161_3098 [Limisphaerales bacterium]KAG0508007.1 MAG: Uncharacterized protein E1N63_2805 [Limisphaerales bacterium]TXT50458.1 MAG: Uncharacterized protein FD140_2381 [Limisphaerales bacterium]